MSDQEQPFLEVVAVLRLSVRGEASGGNLFNDDKKLEWKEVRNDTFENGDYGFILKPFQLLLVNVCVSKYTFFIFVSTKPTLPTHRCVDFFYVSEKSIFVGVSNHAYSAQTPHSVINSGILNFYNKIQV